MITLFFTNRTNRAAIARADAREHQRWRNDAALKAVAAELEISNDVIRELRGSPNWMPREDLKSREKQWSTRIDDIAPHVGALRILVNGPFADTAEALRKALHGSLKAALDLAEDRLVLPGPELAAARQQAADTFYEAKNAQKTFITAACVALGIEGARPSPLNHRSYLRRTQFVRILLWWNRINLMAPLGAAPSSRESRALVRPSNIGRRFADARAQFDHSWSLRS